MFTKTISPTTRQDLASLTRLNQIKNFYLAGGTATALYLGHRFSFDLDFFTNKRFQTKLLLKEVRKLGSFQEELVNKETILGKLGKTKISFFFYPYPLIQKTMLFKKVKIASLPDIGAMKLDAISDRGVKRDFIDLFFILQKYSLENCFQFYDQKYHLLETNLFHLIKSLAYFSDAEKEAMPQMIKKVSWPKIKSFFEKETVRLGKKYLK